MIFRPGVPVRTARALVSLIVWVVGESERAPEPSRPLVWRAPGRCDPWTTPEETAHLGGGSCVSLAIYRARWLLDRNPDRDVWVAVSDRVCGVSGDPCEDEHAWLIVDGVIDDPSLTAGMPLNSGVYKEFEAMPIQPEERQRVAAGCGSGGGCRSDPSGGPYKRERMAAGNRGRGASTAESIAPRGGRSHKDQTRWIVAGGIVGQEFPHVRPYLRQVLAGIEAAAQAFGGTRQKFAAAGDPQAKADEWKTLHGQLEVQAMIKQMHDLIPGNEHSFVNEWRDAMGHDPVSDQAAIRGVRALTAVQTARQDPTRGASLRKILESPPWPSSQQRPSAKGLDNLALHIVGEASGFHIDHSMPHVVDPRNAMGQGTAGTRGGRPVARPQAGAGQPRRRMPLPGVPEAPPWSGPRLMRPVSPIGAWAKGPQQNGSQLGSRVRAGEDSNQAGGDVYNITDQSVHHEESSATAGGNLNADGEYYGDETSGDYTGDGYYGDESDGDGDDYTETGFFDYKNNSMATDSRGAPSPDW